MKLSLNLQNGESLRANVLMEHVAGIELKMAWS